MTFVCCSGVVVWLYEATESALSLGYLGLISLFIQLPMIPFGGILADELDRKKLVSCMMFLASVATLVVSVLNWLEHLSPAMVYILFVVLQVTQRLEGSARGALTASCVTKGDIAYLVIYYKLYIICS